MRVIRPASLEAAETLLAAPDARAAAGATALQVEWAQGKPRPAVMVAIGALVPAGVTRRNGTVTLGAGTTLQAIQRAGLPLLSEATADVAAPGVRRLATVGGTVAWGAGCLVPALLALRAEAETTAGWLPLSAYLAAPAGLLLSFRFPEPGADATLVWRKIGFRAAFSPAVIVASGVRDGARLTLAVGGGPVRPALLSGAAAALVEESDPAVWDRTLRAAIDAPACALRSADYRSGAAARAFVHGFCGTAAGSPPARPRPAAPAAAPALRRLSSEIGGARWHVRPDMVDKIAGRAGYLTDMRREGTLVGRILRAAHPHARILAVDTTAAEALPGVGAVVTARDVQGVNAFGIVFQDQPAFCTDKVRYLGDVVAAVAATDADTADRALALIRVDYAPLPVVDDPEAALAPDAPPVHAAGNLVTTLGLTRGDADAAFATAAHVVEDTYITPRQMHGFMETEGGYAEVLPDGTLVVAAGGQHGARDRMQLARILGRAEDTIRVITSPTGGAFGGKDELTVQPALALLALKAGAPVRLHLSRAESVAAGTKRNPMRIRMRTACDAAGRLVAQSVDVLSDCGAYASLSPGVIETALEHAAGPYRIPNVRTEGRLVYTNNATGGAFRGFGANQMAYAVECQIDRLAAAAGLDPAAMRALNLRQPGDPGFLGQVVAPSERLSEMLEAAAASPLWTPAAVTGEWMEGTGMALAWQGNGLGTIPVDESAGEIVLAPDGAIEIRCGLDEMGQGLHAALAAAVADRLGCARSDVRPVTGDTGRAPDSGSTTASRGGYVVWKAVDLTAPSFAADLKAAAADLLGLSSEALAIVPGGVADRGRNDGPRLTFAALAAALGPERRPSARADFSFPKTVHTKGNARFIFCAGAVVTRVAVSRVSGAVRVLDLHLHTAAGPVIDLASYLGQMEGGAVQGLGFTLSEDVVMRDGRMVTTNFDTYLMPTIRDAPARMTVTACESLDPGDPYGPRGAGELGIAAITPAIANAVADAAGRWPVVAPFQPEALLAGALEAYP